ncbi:hypothetical protein [Rhodospirillaceae bacterium SYSU D60014]|uniref:hypothetical protein n=1 Tax=Virgifigura deserti TaxID=2268457 RepID=UPI000E67239F
MISEADAIAEGVSKFQPQDSDGRRHFSVEDIRDTDEPTAKRSFASLWRSIHGAGAWEVNPQVVITVFKPHLVNIDQWRTAV